MALLDEVAAVGVAEGLAEPDGDVVGVGDSPTDAVTLGEGEASMTSERAEAEAIDGATVAVAEICAVADDELARDVEAEELGNELGDVAVALALEVEVADDDDDDDALMLPDPEGSGIGVS